MLSPTRSPRPLVSPRTHAEEQDKDATLWGRQVAEPRLQLKDGPRRTAQLRIIHHDAHGRAQVRQVTLHWMHIRTGVLLRSQVVTEMDDGGPLATDISRVEQLG